jgi:hypothetical protein
MENEKTPYVRGEDGVFRKGPKENQRWLLFPFKTQFPDESFWLKVPLKAKTTSIVILAKAGIHNWQQPLDSREGGNDEGE